MTDHHRIGLRSGAFGLAFLLCTTAGAAQPAAPSDVPKAEPVAPAPVEDPPPQQPSSQADPYGPALPAAEPTPAAIEPASAPAPSAAIPDPAAQNKAAAIQRAEWTRDTGATVMAGGGAITIVGVILIFAGVGASAAAVKKSDCSTDSDCVLEERKLIHAGRVTLAGLVISGVGAVTLLGGMIGYLAGRNRLGRARGGSFDGFGVLPSQRGVAVGVRGRF